jgi:amino acid adenylation domain-containing protein
MTFLLSQAIDRSAALFPQREAVRFAGQSLTYAALVRRANGLAHVLVAQGVRRGDRVGIFMNKSLDTAVAVYGIMKAGGVYVPLDPSAPAARVRYVIQDCDIRHIVTTDLKLQQSELLAEDCGLTHLTGGNASGYTCISWEDVYAAAEDDAPDVGFIEQDLAYILYTSGSTGMPKGIMHTHRSGLSFAEWAAETYGLTHEDRVSSHAPLHFDLSTFDFFASALAGACVVIIPEAITKFPASLAKLMVDEKISVWYSVPFALIQLMQRGSLATRDLSALRWLLFAGEVFPTKHLRDLMAMLPQVRFSNLYGPTETNVCTFYHVESLPEDNDEPIPIGRPCANVEALIVDGNNQPTPVGEVGELLIRGGVVMRGYWAMPERTERGFYKRPSLGYLEDIFYHTGDLVQQLPDGNLKYLGRKDRQIKTRGYRVELDEIEVALLSYELVEEAAVYPVPDGDGSNLIEAAVTAKPGMTLTTDELTNHIAARLPVYAVPVKIHLLTEFPRTSTGKIDRRTLQEQAQTSNTLS